MTTLDALKALAKDVSALQITLQGLIERVEWEQEPPCDRLQAQLVFDELREITGGSNGKTS